MLADAPTAADDAQVADAMKAASITVAKAPAVKKTPATKKALATKAPAKTGEKAVSVWVGRKIAEMTKAQKRSFLGANFRAVTPSKAGDHTVRLTKAESEALAALATEVENQGGMMALSGRTLRARLDAALGLSVAAVVLRRDPAWMWGYRR